MLREHLLDWFLKFCSGTHRLFEELDRHAKGGGWITGVFNCGAFKELAEHVLFECASYVSQILIFGLFEEGPSSGYFEAFLCGSFFFAKTAFCSGEKQGMLVKCSSWYNRVGDF